MAASGTNKWREGQQSSAPETFYPETNPLPAYQIPAVSSPGQIMFQAPGHHYNHSPNENLMEAATPVGVSRGYPSRPPGGPSGTLNYIYPLYHPRPPVSSTFYQPPSRPFYHGLTQSPAYQRPTYHPHGNPPRPQGGPSGAFNYNYPQNLSSSRQGYPNASYGRGGGRGYNSSANVRRPYHNSGKRKGGSQVQHFSAEERPDLFYRKEMIEDPWKLLKPVVLNGHGVPDSVKSWLPASIRAKEANVLSGEASHQHISQETLAECLSATLN